ncbi:MAG TPA: hypothetical protein VE842_07555 [Pyrinomonadaceae bacterium]|nr:hypothetical protein [Pyrinomonadaceae bacterium]
MIIALPRAAKFVFRLFRPMLVNGRRVRVAGGERMDGRLIARRLIHAPLRLAVARVLPA